MRDERDAPGSRSDAAPTGANLSKRGNRASLPAAPSCEPPCKAAKIVWPTADEAAPRFPTLCVQTPRLHHQISHAERAGASSTCSSPRIPCARSCSQKSLYVCLPLRVHSCAIQPADTTSCALCAVKSTCGGVTQNIAFLHGGKVGIRTRIALIAGRADQ